MKCKNCGIEFEGNFCPECGTKANDDVPVIPEAYAPYPFQQKNKKKKKFPFLIKLLLIILLILFAGMFALISCSNTNKTEKIVWDDLILHEMLPVPSKNKGEIHENTSQQLRVDIANISDKEYAAYIEACKEQGFTVEEETNSYSYTAFNADGYKLLLSHFSSDADMNIELEAPMQMSTITWPDSTAGKQLPEPKSKTGKFSYEYEDSFYVYIGDTSKEEYEEYITECKSKGFSVDYSKSDNSFSALNESGWYVYIMYEGNHVMSISIDPPEEEEKEEKENETVVKEDTSKQETTTETTEKETEKTNDSGLDPDFKAAMDSYEAFMDEYVSFMKKYNENPSDLSLLSDYANYMSKYADFVEDFDAWQDEDMNAQETAYYIDVQARVSKKLLEAAN
jgi:hypothetical protein